MSLLSSVLKNREYLGSTVIIHAFIWLLTLLLTLVIITLAERSALPREIYFHGYLSIAIIGSLFNMTISYWVYFYLGRFTKKLNRQVTLFKLCLAIILPTFISTSTDIYIFSLNFQSNAYQFVNYFIALNFVVKFYFVLIAVFTRFSVDWISQLAVRNATELEIKKTELAILKNQTNPHFLFNTLNALYASSYQHGDNQTASGISSLSHLLRYMLFHNNKERVSLQQEIEQIENYIVLQKHRHLKNIKVEFTQILNMRLVDIAPMLLMPLVENAFKYGIKANNENSITFNLTCSNNKLVFSTTNADHSRLSKDHEQVTKNGFGLDNLKKRLNVLYPQQHQFIASSREGYFVTKLEIICA